MRQTLSRGAPLALNQIVCEGSAFARNLVLARLLGPEQMGSAVALALTLRLIEMVGDFGWDRLLIQAEQQSLPQLRRTVHGLQLFKAAGQIALVALLSMPVLLWVYPDLEPISLYLIAGALLIRAAVHCDYRERQRNHQFMPALLVEGGSNLVALLVVAPVAWLTRDHTALAWAMLFQACGYTLISHAVARRPYALGLDAGATRRCLRYGAPLAANSLLMFAALQGDRFIVALNYTASELASFALAAQLTLLPALMGARLILAFELPRFAERRRDHKALVANFKTDVQLVLLWAMGLTVILGGLGETIIEALYGPEYAIPAGVLWLLALTAGCRLVRCVPNTLLIALERTAGLLQTNAPRIVALPLGLWLAAHGSPLAVIAGLGALAEAAGLAIALVIALRELSRSATPSAIRSFQGAL